MTQSGPKWPKVTQSGPDPQRELGWPKVAQSGPKFQPPIIALKILKVHFFWDTLYLIFLPLSPSVPGKSRGKGAKPENKKCPQQTTSKTEFLVKDVADPMDRCMICVLLHRVSYFARSSPQCGLLQLVELYICGSSFQDYWVF